MSYSGTNSGRPRCFVCCIPVTMLVGGVLMSPVLLVAHRARQRRTGLQKG